ncbi:MAG: hypothetical protein ACJAUO_002126 [Sediminicola sp.]|jgi:hypothetical protein
MGVLGNDKYHHPTPNKKALWKNPITARKLLL